MGTPNLYELDRSFYVNGKVSTQPQISFEIREINFRVAEHAPNRFKRSSKSTLCHLIARRMDSRHGWFAPTRNACRRIPLLQDMA